jgi:hypothetical protein
MVCVLQSSSLKCAPNTHCFCNRMSSILWGFL